MREDERQAALLAFMIPGTPCAQGRPRFSRARGRAVAYDPPQSRSYKARAAQAAAAAACRAGWETALETPVSVSVEAVFAVPKSYAKAARRDALSGRLKHAKKPDLDNVYKCVTDALSGVIYRDDKQIVRAVIAKRYGEDEEEGVYVTVSAEQ